MASVSDNGGGTCRCKCVHDPYILQAAGLDALVSWVGGGGSRGCKSSQCWRVGVVFCRGGGGGRGMGCPVRVACPESIRAMEIQRSA